VIASEVYKSEQLTDHNKIMKQIMLGYFFRILRMILVIFTVSYFFGTLFFIICWQIYDKYDNFDNEYNFFNKNVVNLKDKMDEHEYFDAMITVVYFAFTTLATVGYGDMKPISNTERLIGSFILLFGVAVFSFIMGNFIEMLMEFKIVTADNEDNANLTRWFGLLSRFNKGRPLPKEMTFKIEEYFNYYWANDKNYAVKSEEDKRFLSELPKSIRVDVSTLLNQLNKI
jgi:Ion channel